MAPLETETIMNKRDTPDWDDSFPGILSAMTLAGVLTSCAWLLVSL